MASLSMTMSSTNDFEKILQSPISSALFNPLSSRITKKTAFVNSKSKARARFLAQASLNEKAITGLKAAALAASLVMPDAASAASDFSPSLNNFLLSIAAGGAVLVVVIWAVVGVSSFDPVNRK